MIEKNFKSKHTNNTQSSGGATNTFKLITAGILIEMCFLLYRLIATNPAESAVKYMMVYAAVFIILVATWRKLKEKPLLKSHVYLVLGFSLLFGLTLLTAPPDQSDDIYRYIWDGKLQYSHISPYKYAPADPALTDYHSTDLPKKVNWPEIKTIYPPLAQLLFRLSYSLFGESISGMKFLFLLFMLGSGVLFFKIATIPGRGIIGSPRRGIIGSPRRGGWLILFFSWNPLIIMETSINGHLDIMMAFFVLAFLFMFYRRAWIAAGSMLACAALTKLIPVISLPLVLLYITGKKFFTTEDTEDTEKSFPVILKFFGSFSITVLAAYALYFDSWQNMFSVALNYSTKWFFNNPPFMAILSITRDNATAHYLSFGLFTLIYLLILFRKMPFEKKIFWTFFAFVLLNPCIHPWYLTILVALLCINYSRWVMWWSGTAVISYIIVYQYKLTGVWEDSWWVMAIEYVPLILISVLYYVKSKKTANNLNQIRLNSVK